MFKKGDTVLLVSGDGFSYLVELEGGLQKVRGVGVVDTSSLVGKGPGARISVGNAGFVALEPTVLDRISCITRGAQIISPKDSAFIAMALDVRAGGRVVEGGSGSGALTIVLANLVRPGGKVFSYDLREDFSSNARRNVERAGLAEWVEFKIGDVTKGVAERDADSFMVDIPNPWDALAVAREALKPGGVFGCYCPSMNQTEQAVKALRELAFIGVRSVEILHRELLVGERGTRPSTDMLGHTGYITVAVSPGPSQ